ncbi:hypothetical protein PIB30_035417 [Stylosanthes scabra]|uniref:Uncharacterized protein n=1 Tax=Stylosanthes scabra TaxID=79078 RepID=A0ABU6RDI4_9FABA|nr:hypothetical protein [Stylosanthes scabra]
MHPQQGSEVDNSMLLPKNFKLPNKLRYLKWTNNPFRSLSLTCWPQKLFMLSMRHSKIQKLWDGEQNLPNLEIINLSFSIHLIECPNLNGSPNLKRIEFFHCESLQEVHPSIFRLPKIERIDVSHCKKLKRLCSDYCSPSLQRLLAVGCSNLEEFSVPITTARHPKILVYLASTALREVPTNILHLKNVNFSFSISYSLAKLPSNFATTIVLRDDPEKLEDDTCIILSRVFPTPGFLFLKKLSFVGCKSLSKLPDNIDALQSLQTLWVLECPIITLPERIKNIRQLIELLIYDCEKFQYLPPLPSSIEIIRIMKCKSLERISSLTSKLPLGKHKAIFRFYNSGVNLDTHAYEAVLKDMKSRMVLGVMEDGYSNDAANDCNACYSIPYPYESNNMPDDCFPHDSSRKDSVVIVEVPPDRWISSAGLVFYLRFSQDQPCVLDSMIFGCECYLKNSCNEWERIASSCNQELFGDLADRWVSPLKMESDHMALWYNAKCCNAIKKAIKEGKSCNPTLKFVFYAHTKDSAVELVTKECGIRWMHVDFVKDKGNISHDEMGVVEIIFLFYEKTYTIS